MATELTPQATRSTLSDMARDFDDDDEDIFPRAPTQEEWDQMSPERRAQVVESLPSEFSWEEWSKTAALPEEACIWMHGTVLGACWCKSSFTDLPAVPPCVGLRAPPEVTNERRCVLRLRRLGRWPLPVGVPDELLGGNELDVGEAVALNEVGEALGHHDV